MAAVAQMKKRNLFIAKKSLVIDDMEVAVFANISTKIAVSKCFDCFFIQ
jgi:hypothetical protein